MTSRTFLEMGESKGKTVIGEHPELTVFSIYEQKDSDCIADNENAFRHVIDKRRALLSEWPREPNGA